VIFLKGDTRSLSIYFGWPFESRYKLTPIYPKKAGRNGGEAIISDARLQLRYLSVVYGANTADLNCQVTPAYRPSKDNWIGGYTLNETLLDRPPLGPGGVARVPIMGRSDTATIEFISNSHLPGRSSPRTGRASST
jgi:hypothetical protein